MNRLTQNCASPMQALRSRLFVGSLCVLLVILTAPTAWAFQISPTRLRFQAVQGGGNPASQVVNFYKKTLRQVSWKSSDNAGWLSASAASGVMTASAQVVVTVDTSGLVAGTYSGAVTITLSKGGSVSIPVTLTVAPSSSSGSSTTGMTATLSWAPNTDSDLAGYKVYVGTSSGAYGIPLDVGNVTSYTIGNLTAGTTYYFAVTAYDQSKNESVYSSEVSKSMY